MSTERANLPERGEQLTFESGDCHAMPERFTLRVMDVIPIGMGDIELHGFLIGEHGFPVEETRVRTTVATVEARRLHRYLRT